MAFSPTQAGCYVKPVLQALVLAEHIYEDKSGKKIIAGTFDSLSFGQSSSCFKEVEAADGSKRRIVQGGRHGGSPYAYVSLTDVCDNTVLLLQFVNLSKNLVLFQNEIRIHCDDRLLTVELVLALPPLPISEEGIYAFQILCEGAIIGSHRLIAKKFVE